VWRRDIVEEAGGWSREFTCEDIELTFRVHERLRAEGRDYRIVCLPDPVGVTEGPDTVRKLVAQRERWQRVTIETWWAYRHMLFDRRYGSVGMIGMPFYLLSEILAPLFEMASVAAIAGGVLLGVIEWDLLLWVTALIALVNGVFNACAVFGVDRQARQYTIASLLGFFLLAPLELIVYRPVISLARVKGTWRFMRGDKGWHKFERNLHLEGAS
jgi:cellulose synthase/poly-beta-1,6-N-acetylglucosamine synthase-like glycosyltransferase